MLFAVAEPYLPVVTAEETASVLRPNGSDSVITVGAVAAAAAAAAEAAASAAATASAARRWHREHSKTTRHLAQSSVPYIDPPQMTPVPPISAPAFVDIATRNAKMLAAFTANVSALSKVRDPFIAIRTAADHRRHLRHCASIDQCRHALSE